MKEHALGVQNMFCLKSWIYGPLRKLRFCKWAHPKMQEIIKQVGPSRQLFETVNFAFMKIFDFLVKTALFWTCLLGPACFMISCILGDAHLQNLSFLRGP